MNHTCPTPDKKRFRTRRAAEKEMHRAWREGRRKRLPVRVYRCPCDLWHMTSTPQH